MARLRGQRKRRKQFDKARSHSHRFAAHDPGPPHSP